MSTTRSLRRALAGLASVVFGWSAPAWGQNCDCSNHPCPPFVKYRFEGPPRLCFKHGCPKPICDPCHLPRYGYFPTCWQPWPFPPDWSHCPVPPPGALVHGLPPKAFREPPPLLQALPEETGPKPNPVVPGALREQKWLPPVTPPNVEREARLPRPLPLGPIASTPPVEMPKPLPQLTPVVPEVKPVEKPAPTPYLAPAAYKPPEPPAPPKPAAEAVRPQSIGGGVGAPQMRMVNSKRILLDYDLADVPKPDQAMLELWFTQDGKQWVKDELSITSGSPYIVEVNKEGTYGFLMVARAPGEKSTPPLAGEAPQVWVEVDWTKPAVQLADLRVGGGPMGRSLALAWTATDNNLSRAPVTLSYAQTPDGSWTEFAKGIENTGRYQWQVPANVPQQFFVKVEATDLVGNVGVAQTSAPVQLP